MEKTAESLSEMYTAFAFSRRQCS